MEHGSHAREHNLWRWGTPLVIGACLALMIISAVNAEGTDLRAGRYDDMATIVRGETERYQGIQDQIAALQAEVDELTNAVSDAEVRKFRNKARELEGAAGFSAVSGPGLTITLSDSPEDVAGSSTQDGNLLVVHQQDIQAVINALWRGGAQAITIQGQRIITTTGIKCEGSTIQLGGVPFPQPYVIEAVGDTTSMINSLDSDEYVQGYRYQSTVPDIAIGWSMYSSEQLEAPAYGGVVNLQYATVN